jgi:hypothetical protein
LKNVYKRYQWLKQWLNTYDDSHSLIFPVEWRVAETVCKLFCQDTKYSLSMVLKQWSPIDIKLILYVLQLTMEFEAFLNVYVSKRNWTGEGKSKAKSTLEKDLGGQEDASKPLTSKVDPASPFSGIILEEVHTPVQLQPQENTETKSKEASWRGGRHFDFVGSISHCFEPYLTYFVEAEDK